MYKVNDTVVYGNRGVYKISGIESPSFLKEKDKYYILREISNSQSTIYAKIGSDKVTIRDVMTEKEAEEFLEELPGLEPLYNENIKVREKEYKETLKTCESNQCLSMLKGILQEERRKMKEGKKLNISDNINLQKVERIILSELAVAFGISVDEARQKVICAVNGI